MYEAEDSDYITESSISLNDDAESIDSIDSNSDFMPLDEDELTEVIIYIYEELEDYIQNNILEMASPNFYKNMIGYIIEITVDLLYYAHALDDEEDDEIAEFVEQIAENFMTFSAELYPMRSILYTLNIPDKNPTPKQLSIIQSKIVDLQNIPQPKQKTKEWYEFRYNLITASNLWKALGSESQQNSLIYEKCKPLDYAQSIFGSCNTESPMHWGIKYEPVTVQLYELLFQTKIGDFGCIAHPKYPYIGASPDGINIDQSNLRYGRMIEIKNIVNRDITGIPKEEYWVQTQIQMETCDLDECDFVETRFEEYTSGTSFYEDTEQEHRGVILYFIERINTFSMPSSSEIAKSSAPIYRYMPNDIPLDIASISEWINKTRDIEKNNGLVLLSTIYWYLDEFSCVFIPRNREWFRAAVPKIEALWLTILKERVDGYEHRTSKKRIAKINITNDGASKSYMIQNMPLTNSICLIRFDETGNVI